MEPAFKEIILVPTDFTEVCQNAAEYACQMAKWLNYEVVLLHVINKDTKSKLKKENKGLESIPEELKAIAGSLKEKWQIQVGYKANEGSIFEVIHKTASDTGASLVVLGVHGKKGMQHLIGSHALRVVTKVAVPTLVVQNKAFTPIKKIVIPVTDFAEARQSVEWAVHIAGVFNATIHLFQQNQSDPGLAMKIEVVTKQIVEAFRTKKVKHEIAQAGSKGQLPKQIIEYAREINAGLMVIMTEPDAYSPDFSMGPWDEKIMFNDEEIPVMCINPVELNTVYGQYLSLM